jgi:hypothetical protein
MIRMRIEVRRTMALFRGPKRRPVILLLGSLFIIAAVLLFALRGKNINENSLASFVPLVASENISNILVEDSEGSGQEAADRNGSKGLSVDLYVEDERAFILDEYFKANSSPLYGTGKYFVAACDQYGAPKDCITTVAIARAETDLCKYHNSATY